MFIALTSWQSHCESSLGSRHEYRSSAQADTNLWTMPAGLYSQPNHIQHRHLLLLLSPKAGTRFTAPRGVEG